MGGKSTAACAQDEAACSCASQLAAVGVVCCGTAHPVDGEWSTGLQHGAAQFALYDAFHKRTEDGGGVLPLPSTAPPPPPRADGDAQDLMEGSTHAVTDMC